MSRYKILDKVLSGSSDRNMIELERTWENHFGDERSGGNNFKVIEGEINDEGCIN